MKNKILLKSLAGLCALAAVACGGGPGPQGSVAVYLDESQPIEKRVEDALSRMILEEKVAILHAQSKFSSAGVPRLGIPEVWCTDGPHGIRPEVLWDEWDQAGWTNDSCTAFPALTCLAATWNPEMSALYGKSIGEEARYREKDILLGPGVNIYRTPLNGRNFEYMGEDPYLSSRMVVPYIEEVQKNGVAACVKHFALNNQEAHRHGIDVEVDDRALNEIYLPAFKAAVQEGGAWAVMGAYNKYKGEHCCHNRYLLNDILKRDWAFDGVVVSDWGGTHDTKQAAENGLDMEFGSWTDGLSWGASNAYDNYYLAAPYLDMLRKGEASTATLDDKARRVLRLIFRTAMNTRKPFGSLNSPEHLAAARRIAGEGMVLLKNEGGVLPIDLGRAKTIAVVGENAIKMMTVGGGSSSLKVRHEYTPLEGIRAAAAGKAEVIYERGYVGDVTGDYNGVKTGFEREPFRNAADRRCRGRGPQGRRGDLRRGAEQEQPPGLRRRRPPAIRPAVCAGQSDRGAGRSQSQSGGGDRLGQRRGDAVDRPCSGGAGGVVLGFRGGQCACRRGVRCGEPFGQAALHVPRAAGGQRRACAGRIPGRGQGEV